MSCRGFRVVQSRHLRVSGCRDWVVLAFCRKSASPSFCDVGKRFMTLRNSRRPVLLSYSNNNIARTVYNGFGSALEVF